MHACGNAVVPQCLAIVADRIRERVLFSSDADTILATVLSEDVHKQCGCGRMFTAHEWSLLESVGRMSDNVETIELRNCPCGSTIATVVDLAHASTLPPSK